MTACTVSSEKPGYTATDTVATELHAAPSTIPPVESRTTPADNWSVTSAGIGSIRAGMSIAELKAAFGDSLVIPTKLAECDYVRPKSEPKGLSFMIENGKLSRVDVRNNTAVRTAAGAGIGDTEDRVKSLYPGQVKVQPHKYTDGHYLVVTPTGSPGDERIIFETDGKTVIELRSGRTPAVEYVEGCS